MTSEIKHVVVLMLENRSFDHMLGFLDHADLEPVTKDPIENPVDPGDPNSEKHIPFALNDHDSRAHDPKHGYPDVMRQLTATTGPWQAPYELNNNGFAWNYQEQRGGPAKEVR